jgi:hypothetical protein
MRIRINKKIAVLILLIISLIISFFGVTFITPSVFGNITNATVITKVNVTNTEPFVYNVVITPSPIILVPGNYTKVTCTAYVRDWNGWQDFSNGTHNATFYDVNYNYRSPDDNNTHYSNYSCGNCIPIAGDPEGTNATCNCSFNVYYYANDTTWQCNFSIMDSGGAYWYNSTRRRRNITNWNATNTTIDPLIAIDVPASINYGEVGVTENSSMIQANLSNFGNININISVDGWGGDNETEGQNLSMICHRSTDGRNLANISIGHEKYSLNPNTALSNMTNLSSTQTFIINLTLRQRLNDSTQVFGYDKNATYWRIYIPPATTGFCNGTIRFTARPIPEENMLVNY